MASRETAINDISSSGSPVAVSGPQPDLHTLQFYSDDSFLLDELSRFVGKALGAGDASIVVATEEHRAGLAKRLALRGLNVSLAVQQGRYVVADARETLSRFMVGGLLDEAAFFHHIGGLVARLRAATGDGEIAAFGEMVVLLWADGYPEAAIRLEQLWNELRQKYRFTLRCAYPISAFDRASHAEVLTRVCAEHNHIIPTENYTLLLDEQARLREVVRLQQKALALEAEIVERRGVQRMLEERTAELSDFLQNALEGVQQLGPDRSIRWANPALLQLLGYSQEEYIGHQMVEFYVEPMVFEELWQRLMRRQDVCGFSAELRCKDGSTRHFKIHSNGLWEEDEFQYTRCFLRDVTEQERAERALIDSEKLASVGRLAASVAHEINNPLEAVTNLIYLVKNSEDVPESVRWQLDIADQELARVAHIAQQTLGFYRDNSRLTQANVVRIVSDVTTIYERKFRYRNIEVEQQIPAELQVYTFSGELKQCLSNLIVNAADACRGGGKIVIRARAACDPGNPAITGVRITIADNGDGIPTEARPKIFSPFFTTKSHVGTGLGLWVSKCVVEKHGGRIRFRSRCGDGHGTVFSVFVRSLATVIHQERDQTAA